MTAGVAEPLSLWIFGAGGHGREVAWLAREALGDVDITFVVDDARFASGAVDGVPIRVLADIAAPAGARFITAIGDAGLRRRAVAALVARGLQAISLIHPRAIVAPTATIGDGALVAAGAVVSDRVRMGSHAIVNIGSTLSHDVHVGDFATISPGVHLAGHVRIGDGAFVGIGATAINGSSESPLVIGDDAIVGAGAVVLADVAAGATVVGVPARPIGSGGRA